MSTYLNDVRKKRVGICQDRLAVVAFKDLDQCGLNIFYSLKKRIERGLKRNKSPLLEELFTREPAHIVTVTR